jgi:hypothetical protein
MFPEVFAEHWIDRLTRKGDVVLDPFSGRGTTSLAALLKSRKAIATDVNEVAYCLTKAKTTAPTLSTVLSRLASLEKGFDRRAWWRLANRYEEFFQHAFHGETLQQLLYLRSVLQWRTVKSDGMIAALALGSLHGDVNKAGTYFSNQMPRTISTKPGYSVRFWKSRRLVAPKRDIFGVLQDRARYRYEDGLPSGTCQAYNADMRTLPRLSCQFPGKVRTVITSPPYLDTTNFEEDQWLRLWFLGGPSRPVSGRLSRDDRYSNESGYWSFIGDMWRSLGEVLAPRANIVLRIGCRRTAPEVLALRVFGASRLSGRKTELVEQSVTEIRNRQARAVNKSSKGCRYEVDCHIWMA